MISPLFFRLIQLKQKYYEKAVQYAGLKGEEVVFDCIMNSIFHSLYEESEKVYGIEVVKDAIVDAEENAD